MIITSYPSFRLKWALLSVTHGGYVILVVSVQCVGLFQTSVYALGEELKKLLGLRSYDISVKYVAAIRDPCDDCKRYGELFVDS